MEAINPIFLTCYLIIIFISLFLYQKRDNFSYSKVNLSNISYNKIYTVILPLSVILIGTALRLYKLSKIPEGLHQDEASIGYEAYILSAFGIDRDGNRYPVYPITYGSGGGSPLMIYLNAVTTFLFGSNALTLRALPAFLGCLTLVITFFVIKILSHESIIKSENATSIQYVTGEFLWLPLVSLCIIAFCPWHIMLSRWSLDSNTTPFWVLLAMLTFVIASTKQKESAAFENIGTLFKFRDRKKRQSLRASDGLATFLYALSAFLYALCLYSYGAATFVIPVHLILMCILFTKTKRMTSFQVFFGVLIFAVFSAPLFAFYIVNIFNLPEVITPFFTITKFTAKRSVFASGSGILLAIGKNLFTMIKNLSVGDSSEQILNYIPGFPPFYAFTFPMTLLGIIVSIIRAKRGELIDLAMHSLFLPGLLFGLFVEEDLTRMVLVFIPVVYYLARGFIFVVNEFVTVEKNTASPLKHYAAIFAKSVTPFLFIAGALFFNKVYLTEFNDLSAEAYMPGYGQACAYADECVSEDFLIYSTYDHVSAPFMIALYYTKTSPVDFLQTVHYKDPDAEFRIADSFTHFRFGLPEDIAENGVTYLNEGNVFIFHKSELDQINNAPGYDPEAYIVKSFGNFVVIASAN
ncbi:hypothetical protein [Butyrivibrio sp. JL13D10]|uniref:hypothetical protein n=1 Tax=Butyrivibrio sp. JL13D10 TaxID=3236815 RepID=UPI0038B452AD